MEKRTQGDFILTCNQKHMANSVAVLRRETSSATILLPRQGGKTYYTEKSWTRKPVTAKGNDYFFVHLVSLHA